MPCSGGRRRGRRRGPGRCAGLLSSAAAHRPSGRSSRPRSDRRRRPSAGVVCPTRRWPPGPRSCPRSRTSCGHDGEPLVRQPARHARDAATASPWVTTDCPRPPCPTARANLVHAFHMPSECQTERRGQRLEHRPPLLRQRDEPRLRGGLHRGVDGLLPRQRHALHLRAGPDLPHRRPVVLLGHGQTNPNRRYLFSGTSLGLINDTFPTGCPPTERSSTVSTATGSPGRTTTPTCPSPLVYISLANEAVHHRQVREDGGVLRGRGGRDAAAVLDARAQLHRPVGGEPPGHPVRRPVPVGRGQRRPAVAPSGRRP